MLSSITEFNIILYTIISNHIYSKCIYSSKKKENQPLELLIYLIEKLYLFKTLITTRKQKNSKFNIEFFL